MPDQMEAADSKVDRAGRAVLLLAGLVLIALFWAQMRTLVMFVITLGVLIYVHELGHFLAAKWAGVRVYEFALGFGPRLWTYARRGGTDYTIRWIPLGGFVSMKGMDPEEDPGEDGLGGKPKFQRAVVYLAGPLMNLALAVVLLCSVRFLVGTEDMTKVLVGGVNRHSEAERMGLRIGDRILAFNGEPIRDSDHLIERIHGSANQQIKLTVARDGQTGYLIGAPQPKIEVQAVKPGSQAARMGLREDDRIVKLNGQPIRNHTDLIRRIQGSPRQEVTLTVERGGSTIELTGMPSPDDLDLKTIGLLGFGPAPGVGPRQDLVTSVREGWKDVRGFFLLLGAMFQKRLLFDSLGGPLAIAQAVGEITRLPVFYYVHQISGLSLSLFVFNLLPIPVLDGGHLLLLLVEAVRRRRLPPEALRAVQVAGLVVIGTIFVLVLYKDIVRLLS
ncbi:MAG: RIP metalloprotease RseP [Armatimonadetes bacterium]|nr:RIP metalloprotease RseP [Armatimonadota bacterium]